MYSGWPSHGSINIWICPGLKFHYGAYHTNTTLVPDDSWPFHIISVFYFLTSTIITTQWIRNIRQNDVTRLSCLFTLFFLLALCYFIKFCFSFLEWNSRIFSNSVIRYMSSCISECLLFNYKHINSTMSPVGLFTFNRMYFAKICFYVFWYENLRIWIIRCLQKSVELS